MKKIFFDLSMKIPAGFLPTVISDIFFFYLRLMISTVSASGLVIIAISDFAKTQKNEKNVKQKLR